MIEIVHKYAQSCKKVVRGDLTEIPDLIHSAPFVLMAAFCSFPPPESPSKGDTKCEEL